MSFSKEIVRWYRNNKRDLPWRNTKNPYVIWLSEVILQQTRVEQGLPYFERFLEHYPSVIQFANAPEDEILMHWQGLGYYSRARNMHKAAKMIVSERNGVFPSSYNDLIRLPGVGEYTAAAISSFSSGEARSVVDGNVFRVLARYFGIKTPINSSAGKKLFQTIAEEILDVDDPGTHNQAMMEFGALLCRPKSPDCTFCPIALSCEALKDNLVGTLPVKTKNKPSKNRFFNYFVVQEEEENGIYLEKRSRGDIWESLYQLPLIETTELIPIGQLSRHPSLINWFGSRVKTVPLSGVIKHVLSHQNLHTQFFEIRDAVVSSEKKQAWNYVMLKDLNSLAKPKLIYAFLASYFDQNKP